MLAFVDLDGVRRGRKKKKKKTKKSLYTGGSLPIRAVHRGIMQGKLDVETPRRDRFEPSSGISSAIQEDSRSSCFLSEV